MTATPPIITRSNRLIIQPSTPFESITELTMDDELLTIKQVCDLLKISRTTLYRIEAHLLRFTIANKSVRYSKASVVNYLNYLNQQNQPNQ